MVLTTMESSSKTQQVVLSPPEVPSVWRNLKLITSPWNVFMFLVHPAFAFCVSVYTPLHLREPSALDAFVPFGVRLVAGMMYLVVAVILASNRSDQVKKDLRKRGYDQRGPLQRRYMPWSGVGLLFVLNECFTPTSLSEVFGLWASLAVYFIMMRSAAMYTILGTILLLTVRID